MEVFLLPLALAVISLCAGAVWGAALLVWDAIRPQPSEPHKGRTVTNNLHMVATID